MNRSALNTSSILLWVELTCSFASISEVSVEHSQKHIWRINWQIHKFKWRAGSDGWFYWHFDIRLHNVGSIVLLNHCLSIKHFVSGKSLVFHLSTHLLHPSVVSVCSIPLCPHLMLRIHPLALSESLVIFGQDQFKNCLSHDLFDINCHKSPVLTWALNCFSTQYWPCLRCRNYTVRIPQIDKGLVSLWGWMGYTCGLFIYFILDMLYIFRSCRYRWIFTQTKQFLQTCSPYLLVSSILTLKS